MESRKKTSMVGLGLVILSLTVLVGLAPSVLAQTTIKWKCSVSFPATEWNVKGVWVPFAKEVHEKTNGKLEITVYPGGELGYPEPEMLRFVRDGRIPIAELKWPSLEGEFPLGNFCMLPFLAKDLDDMQKVVHPIWNDLVQKPLEKNWNTVVLIDVSFAPSHLFSKGQPLNSIEAFKGRRLRHYGGYMADIFKELGASSTFIVSGEVYPSYQRGLIDGGPTSWASAKDQKLPEVLSWCTECGMVIPHSALGVNKAALDALPKDVREVLFKVAEKWQANALDVCKDAEKEAKDYCIGRGIKAIQMPPDVLEKLMKISNPMWKKWAEKAGPLGQEALDRLAKARGWK